MNVHPRIAARIREIPPPGAFVIQQSLPVVSFGDPAKANALTISLNPSWHEFWDNNREWLDGENRRLESLRSLKVASPQTLSDVQVELVHKRSCGYFTFKPYNWFNSLDSVLREALQVSYFDGSASHLDLVQWATEKVQGEIVKEAPETWHQLVKSDAEFLRWQLETSPAKTIVVNGVGTIDGLQAEGILPSLEIQVFKYPKGKGSSTLNVFSGKAYGKRVVGWNITAANGIPTEARPLLIKAVSELGGV